MAESGQIKAALEFLTTPEARTVELVIVDLHLPDGSGLELIDFFNRSKSRFQFVLLTADLDETLLQKAMALGAAAYLNKSQPLSSLLRIIEQLGLSQSKAELTNALFPEELTQRERHVLHIAAGGARNSEIASHLFISETTVKTHLAAINRKLGTTNRTMAIAKARVLGII